MKHYISIFLAVLWSTGILVSCKKENGKDYSTSIKDKTWWGRVTYSGQTAEYYSVHFRSDGTLLWSQLNGDYEGSWEVKGKQLTITFNANSVIKADISGDDKMRNITDNVSSYDVNSGQIVSNLNTSLENTVWKGTITNTASYPIQMNFLPDTKVLLYLGSSSYSPWSYTRSESGTVIRATIEGVYHFFCILTSPTEMKGSNTNYNEQFQLTKQ